MRTVEVLYHVVLSKLPVCQHELHASRRDDAAALRPLELLNLHLELPSRGAPVQPDLHGIIKHRSHAFDAQLKCRGRHKGGRGRGRTRGRWSW